MRCIIAALLLLPFLLHAQPEPEAGPTPPPTGIGAGLRQDPRSGVISVSMVIPGAPADRNGLKTGDIILQVNGIPVIGKTLPDTVELIKGDLGTPVTLMIQRPGRPDPLDITIIREMFVVPE